LTEVSNVGRFGYTGQIWLEDAGVWHYKARAYHPDLGRFMQTDPIGQAGGMNIYAYVGGDPVNYTDPSGLRRSNANQCTGSRIGGRSSTSCGRMYPSGAGHYRSFGAGSIINALSDAGLSIGSGGGGIRTGRVDTCQGGECVTGSTQVIGWNIAGLIQWDQTTVLPRPIGFAFNQHLQDLGVRYVGIPRQHVYKIIDKHFTGMTPGGTLFDRAALQVYGEAGVVSLVALILNQATPANTSVEGTNIVINVSFTDSIGFDAVGAELFNIRLVLAVNYGLGGGFTHQVVSAYPTGP
jgi:RHS repeat-associated protein